MSAELCTDPCRDEKDRVELIGVSNFPSPQAEQIGWDMLRGPNVPKNPKFKHQLLGRRLRNDRANGYLIGCEVLTNSLLNVL